MRPELNQCRSPQAWPLVGIGLAVRSWRLPLYLIFRKSSILHQGTATADEREPMAKCESTTVSGGGALPAHRRDLLDVLTGEFSPVRRAATLQDVGRTGLAAETGDVWSASSPPGPPGRGIHRSRGAAGAGR